MSDDNLTDISSINPREDKQSCLSSQSTKIDDNHFINNYSNINQHNRSSLQEKILCTRRQVSRKCTRQKAIWKIREIKTKVTLIIFFITY